MRSVRLYVLLLTFFAASLSAFAQKPTTALELNNYFASINDSLYAGGREWGIKLNTVVFSKGFDSLAPLRMRLDEFIDRKTNELKTMKDIRGSDKFRLAMLDFLAFESKMMKEAFAPIEKLNKTSTQDQIKTAINNLMELAAQEDSHLVKVNEAQNEYASKNGFTIEKKE